MKKVKFNGRHSKLLLFVPGLKMYCKFTVICFRVKIRCFMCKMIKFVNISDDEVEITGNRLCLQSVGDAKVEKLSKQCEKRAF